MCISTSKKSCSFFGHRDIELTEELKQNVQEIIEDLIVNHQVTTFLIGTRSDFIDLCYNIVTKLKEKFPKIERHGYRTRSETFFFENERERMERIYSKMFKEKVNLCIVEQQISHKTMMSAGRASYVERNEAMIQASDYCIFYYDEDYKPKPRKYSKNGLYYQPKSGTAIAFDFALQKKKNIINVFDMTKILFKAD